MNSQDKKFTICFVISILFAAITINSILLLNYSHEKKVEKIVRHIIEIKLENGKRLYETIDKEDLKNE